MTAAAEAMFREMRELAYAVPLTQARGAALPYFRQLDAEVAVGLTVNK
jgi:hypothetical protein